MDGKVIESEGSTSEFKVSLKDSLAKCARGCNIGSLKEEDYISDLYKVPDNVSLDSSGTMDGIKWNDILPRELKPLKDKLMDVSRIIDGQRIALQAFSKQVNQVESSAYSALVV